MSETITTISKSRMAEFCDTIVRQVRECLVEREEDILAAWHENIAEANENEKKFPPLKLSIAATVDLEANCIETTASFTVKYSSTIKEQLPDPNQAVMNFAATLKPGESVEITTPTGNGVKIESGGKITKTTKSEKS